MTAYGNSYFGQGVGQIAATNLQCVGTEDNLYQCPNSTSHTCDHTTDVGVDCTAPFGTCQAAGFTECCTSDCNVDGCYCDAACYGFGDCCFDDIAVTCPQSTGMTRLYCNFAYFKCLCCFVDESCTEDTIRISGGDNTNEGLVELCIDSQWTSICDEGWGTNEAIVACSEAGFSSVGMSCTSIFPSFRNC